MKKFERNELALIQKEIRDNVSHPKIGKVAEVYEHGRSDDDSNFEIDVTIDGGTGEEQYVPVITGGSGAIDIPKAGDKVMLHYTEEQNPKPYGAEIVWTNRDRPPVGKAGMWRREWKSDTSPVGDGNLYLTGYTSFDEEAANTEKYELTPEQALIQIAKHGEGDNLDPTELPDLPFKFEIFDSPIEADDQMHVTFEGNQVDADDTKGMDVTMDFKAGTIHVRGENAGDTYEIVLDVKNETLEIKGDSNAGNKMGASFDFDANTFKIADGNKFGIESDGSGNFTWSHKSIDFKEETGSSGTINL